MKTFLKIYIWWLEKGITDKFDQKLSLKLDAAQQLIENYG